MKYDAFISKNYIPKAELIQELNEIENPYLPMSYREAQVFEEAMSLVLALINKE